VARPLAGSALAETSGGKRLVIAMMPKAKGDPYFVSCLAGAEEAGVQVQPVGVEPDLPMRAGRVQGATNPLTPQALAQLGNSGKPAAMKFPRYFLPFSGLALGTRLVGPACWALR